MSTDTFCPECGLAVVEDCECMFCDSDCIGVTGKGDAGRELEFFGKFDPDPNNVATCEPTGFLALPPDYILSPPGCQAFHSVAQAIASDDTIVVALDSERYDSTGTMHSNVTENSRVVFPIPGVYIVTFDAAFSAVATGDRQVSIRKNGLEQLGVVAKRAVNSATIVTGMSLTIVEEFVAGEYVEALARSDGGAPVNLLATRYSPNLTVQFRRKATT